MKYGGMNARRERNANQRRESQARNAMRCNACGTQNAINEAGVAERRQARRRAMRGSRRLR